MIRDSIKCCNCEYIGTVERGSDICPHCGAEGTLQWDSEEQEVEE